MVFQISLNCAPETANRKRNFCKISLCAVPFFQCLLQPWRNRGTHEEKMCKVNFYWGRKKWGNIQQKGRFLKCCAKGGPAPVPFPSEGNSMPVRGYTVYVYITYIMYIYIYIHIHIHVYGFSVVTEKVLSFEGTKY